MTWVDGIALGVLALSALLAFQRGFVREVLGIGAWIASLIVAMRVFPYARPHVRAWLGSPDFADPITFAVSFVAVLIVLSIIAHRIGRGVRSSALGGVDRTLGLVFGLVRGAVLVVFAYIAAGLVLPVERWPEPVLFARFLPATYAGAAWATGLLPAEYRPKLQAPPAGRQTTAEELLRASPQGRATSRPAGRD